MSDERSLYDRLGQHEGILKLIKPFYADVRQHAVIGPIFDSHIQDWPAQRLARRLFELTQSHQHWRSQRK